MTAASRPVYTIDEYVRLEERANVKHEFLGGTIWAMAGGTPEHARMASAIIAALGAQLRGRPCSVYTADARVRVVATGLDTYPDVTVVCGHEERDVDDRNALTNPVALFEVTSDGSEVYDRGEKLAHYKRIPSVREIVIVSHRQRRIEIHRRSDDGGAWQLIEAPDRAELAAIGCTLDVAEIYRDPLAQ
jgi:Uma2 family endonuclease